LNLLLDTHIFIWWRTNDARLRPSTRAQISRAAEVYVSVVSAWETAIKMAVGKLRLSEGFEAGVEASGFLKLAVRFPHVERVATLPLHHHDPFDRMLIAQAEIEGLAVVSDDRWFAAYDVPLLRA
jgi:PIN domain nuclease of toxin-antitoxin system